jgi:phosphatidylserine decarboxylase
LIEIFYRMLIELTNRKSTSRVLAKFTKSAKSRILIPSFAKVYSINLDEMEKPLCKYKTLQELFTRKLKKSVRRISEEPYAVVSPVDASIEDLGRISLEHTFIVKGKQYSIIELLGSDQKAQKYLNGTYMIFYLSPSDYHWIHSPVTGKVVEQWTLGTKSYPVNKYGLKYGKKPLSKNYRLMSEVCINDVSMVIVKVGAMFINSIEIVDEGSVWKKGNEIGYFSFGSTVLLLFEEGTFEPSITSSVPCKVKVGECIGFLKNDY